MRRPYLAVAEQQHADSRRFLKWESGDRQVFSVGVHTDSKAGDAGLFSDVRAILGTVKDCLVVMDACSPAGVWTRDGLYAGAFNDDVGIAPKREGWEALAFVKVVQDDNQWGQVIETAGGDVLWGLMRHNSTPFYRITGWDDWERQHGTLPLKAAAAAARRKGNGLAGEYFASPGSDWSKPSLRRVDPDIWFGPMRGSFRKVDTLHTWFNAKETKTLSLETPFSTRWTGWVEAPLDHQQLTFHGSTYARV